MLRWIINFVERATRETAVLRANGAEEAARARERLLTDLTEAVPDEEELLTLTAAARESGYSSRTLQRMMLAGRLTNYGGLRRPRVRRSELPRRPSGLREVVPTANLETAKGRIARSVINPRGNDDTQSKTI